MSHSNEELTSSSVASTYRYSVLPDICDNLAFLIEMNQSGEAHARPAIRYRHVAPAPKRPSPIGNPFVKLLSGAVSVVDENVVPSLEVDAEQEKSAEIGMSFKRKYVSSAFGVDDVGRGDEPRPRLSEIICMEEKGNMPACPVEKPDNRCVPFLPWM